MMRLSTLLSITIRMVASVTHRISTSTAGAALALTLIISVSCQRRDITYDYYPYCDVELSIDWSKYCMSVDAKTMALLDHVCILFYPVEGGSPIRVDRNFAPPQPGDYIRSINVDGLLREGKYNLILFNDWDFNYMEFRNMESFDNASVGLVPASSKWYNPTRASEFAAEEPENICMDVLRDFTVTRQMVERSRSNRKANREESTDLNRIVVEAFPRSIVVKTIVRLYVANIQNAASLQGTIAGFSDSYLLSQGRAGDGVVTHLFNPDRWERNVNSSNLTKGHFLLNFDTFGLPFMTTRVSGVQSKSGWYEAFAGTRALLQPDDVELKVWFNLVDGKQQEIPPLAVGDRLQIDYSELSQTYTITIDVGAPSSVPDSNPDLDDPIVIKPDVTPPATSSSGFKVDLDDWEDGETISVPLS